MMERRYIGRTRTFHQKHAQFSRKKTNSPQIYQVLVNLDSVQWSVQRRYSDFARLHEQLCSDYRSLDRALLPPKKVFGRSQEQFLQQRRSDLEVYLLTLWHHLRCLPTRLAEFLDFHLYEVHYITESLARELFQRGDAILAREEDEFELAPLQLYAVNRRLSLAEPTCPPAAADRDIGHVLDVFQQLRRLRIRGSGEKVGTSSLNGNQFEMDLTLFKSLESLTVSNTKLENIRTRKTCNTGWKETCGIQKKKVKS